MRLFGRRRQGGPQWDPAAAASLWDWWSGARNEVARSIESGEVGRFVEDVSRRIDEIHPNLAWEFSKGSSAEHLFVVSAEGVAELRAIAERVIRMAPLPDAVWEYTSARLADPNVDEAVLQIDDTTIELGSIRFVATLDEQRAELDVVASHPAFDRLEDAGMRVTFLALDWALGEDTVERWIGAVGVAPASWTVEDELTTAQLRDAVAKLASTTEPSWVLLGVEGEDTVVVARRPLKRVEFPTFDLRVEIAVVLESNEALQAAQELDERMLELLGGSGMHAASVTHRGTRTSIFYCDSEDASIETLESSLRDGAATAFAFDSRMDATWEAVRDYQ